MQFITACGLQTESDSGNMYSAAVPMETTPVIDYKLPEQTANVLVSRVGYQADSRKEAAVKGKTLPDSFRIVQADSGEVVYTGDLKRVSYHADLDLSVGYASFDELLEPGTYYVECDIVGRSYTFTVEEVLYARLFGETYHQLLENARDGSLSLRGAIALLTAYDWYIELFPDEDGDEVPDVMAGLAEWMESYEEQAQDEDQLLRAAFLAKFSYLYQNYNRRYATSCLQRATTLYSQTQNTMQKDAEHFFALTELYRATGVNTYRVQIEDYSNFFENNSSYLDETEYLYGVMTYLMTRQKVDRTFCDGLMKKLMMRGEEIAGYYDEIVHPVSAHNNGTEDMLQHVQALLFVNYVLGSYQYYNIEKDFLSFLGGRNLESVNFYAAEADPESYILLLSQLTAQNQIQK